MAIHIRTVAAPVLSVLLAFWGFGAAADRDAHPVKGRALLEASARQGEWTAPGPYEGSSHAVQSRVSNPGLRLALPAEDAYRLRIFYKLEGKSAGGLLIGGRPAARLEPGRWSRVSVNSPLVRQGEALQLSFQVPADGKLFLRRVDFRNYLFRAGPFFLLKPAGGHGLPPTPLQVGLFLFALIFLGACLSLAGPGRNGKGLDHPFWLWCGGAGGFLVLHQWISPYPIHAVPLALGILFVAAAGAGVLSRLAGGGSVILRRAGLAAAGVLFALLIAEGSLWIWNPPISRPRIGSYAVYSEAYGWMNRPGTEGWQVDIRYHIRINRFGHRGGEYPEKKPGGEFRILGLGDSFTFGWGVAEEETFLQGLERRLRAAGHRVRVMNAAVPAWHSSQSLHYLLRDGLRFEPDLVVMSFFMDDVFEAKVEGFRQSGKARELQAEEASLRRRKNRVGSLRLYNLWFNYSKLLRASRDHRRRNPYPTFEAERERILSVSSQRDFEKIPAYREGLDRMIGEWAKAREAHRLPMAFTFIPAGGALGRPGLQGHARALQRSSLAHGLPYVDVVSRLERQPDPRKLYLHPRDGHMSAAGHAVVAEALADLILRSGWLKAEPPGR